MSESPLGEADSPTDQSHKEFSTECPTCGRDDFKNVRGMKQHHAKTHNESLVSCTYTCHNCGSDVERQESLKRNGEKSFCDHDCFAEYKSEIQGEDHPLYNLATVECTYCGNEMNRRPSRLERHENLFCSQSCHSHWRSENIVGENHHQYTGYDQNEYGPNWLPQRKKALKRDQYRCQRCLRTPRELGQEPDVHHKKRIEWFRENFDSPEWYERGNAVDNLTSLCRSCHNLWEGIPLDLDVRLGKS